MSTNKYKYCLEVRFSVKTDNYFHQPFGRVEEWFINKYYGNNKRKLISYSKELCSVFKNTRYTFDYAMVFNLEDN